MILLILLWFINCKFLYKILLEKRLNLKQVISYKKQTTKKINKKNKKKEKKNSSYWMNVLNYKKKHEVKNILKYYIIILSK